MRECYMPLAHQLSLCIMKKKHIEPARLVSKHNDLRGRERGRVTRLSLEIGCDYPSVKVTWS